MPDMLVKLYELPPVQPVLEQQKAQGIDIRRALPPEKRAVVQWVADKFGNGWASECDVAFSNNPVSCFIAVKDGQLIGFACHDATCRDFFGPTGVDPAFRGKGTGKALLLACLDAMAAQGYAYAIIGGAGPVDFYAKVAGATVIDGSVPGIYNGMLKL
ncbi:GNAT family N-acetyltransferase [Mahella australiensis]|uniref:GCN5-related N-acetyltransferase n=1 Tax=Mahella australiensis (strain DSM 15567 / CIP 107919 / 50-1 BON) TaxID=697281 RepID=F3ZVA8_MAHA5|nr:GNAT family N-acetyltransferase [Mahella australiensis]AEE95258.1 GCN5-related N-acetyltransferase [Mahella australiensis 50-1 BON]